MSPDEAGTVIRASTLELTGRRVLLRPLVEDDFAQWQEVRRRCRIKNQCLHKRLCAPIAGTLSVTYQESGKEHCLKS